MHGGGRNLRHHTRSAQVFAQNVCTHCRNRKFSHHEQGCRYSGCHIAFHVILNQSDIVYVVGMRWFLTLHTETEWRLSREWVPFTKVLLYCMSLIRSPFSVPTTTIQTRLSVISIWTNCLFAPTPPFMILKVLHNVQHNTKNLLICEQTGTWRSLYYIKSNKGI